MEKLSQQLEYLTSDKVGKTIYEGLSELYDTKPEHPISFLAKWLLNHSATEKNKVIEQETEEIKNKLIAKLNEVEEKRVQEKQKEEELQAVKEENEAKFMRRIKNHLYLEEMTYQEFPEYLKQATNLPAVYIGQLGYPVKTLDENEEDINGHLDVNQERIIRYVGASKNQRFILGQTLPESSVTHDAFLPQEDQQPDEEGDEDEEGGKKEPKPTYIYVPDVTKEPRMSFLRIPRLGAFIACNLVCNSVLSDVAFDEGIKERLRVEEERENQQKEKDAKDEEYRQKIEDAEDEGRDAREIEEEWKNIVWDEIKEKDFESEKKELVLCADTLGEDREIPLEQRKYLEEAAKYFVSCWEESERNQLSNDIDNQIKYMREVNKEEFLREFNEKIEDGVIARLRREAQEEEEHEDNSIPAELKESYLQAVAKAEQLREALQEEDIKNYIINLKEYRVVKSLGVLQNALFLVGYGKGQINQPNTNLVDWKVTKHFINENDFFKKLASYEIKGPKEGKFKTYAKPQKILNRLEGMNVEEIDDFNVGLGVLFRFLKQALEARLLDVQVRKAVIEGKRTKREQLIQDAEALVTAKEQALEQAKENLGEEEEFNQEEWEKEWEENNPPIEIPEEVEDDIDNDMLLEEEIEVN